MKSLLIALAIALAVAAPAAAVHASAFKGTCTANAKGDVLKIYSIPAGGMEHDGEPLAERTDWTSGQT
jgi:hypothetical protein